MALGNGLILLTKIDKNEGKNDMEWEGDIDLLPSRNCFMFPVSYETVDRNMKIIKMESVNCPQKCQEILLKLYWFADQNLQVKCGYTGSGDFAEWHQLES